MIFQVLLLKSIDHYNRSCLGISLIGLYAIEGHVLIKSLLRRLLALVLLTAFGLFGGSFCILKWYATNAKSFPRGTLYSQRGIFAFFLFYLELLRQLERKELFLYLFADHN